MSQQSVTIELTYDQALVLCEFFARFQDDNTLAFAHPAEYLALARIAGQLDHSVSEMFLPDYQEILEAARARVAEGFEGGYPGPRVHNIGS